MLSNLVSIGLDDLLSAVSAKYGLSYTRYSDDVTFSTGGQFSRKLASRLIVEVSRAFAAFGHLPHKQKIVIAPPGSQRSVLGLLVDGDKLRLRPEFKARVRNHVRGIEDFGISGHAEHRKFASVWGLARHLGGSLSYARSIEPSFAQEMKTRLDEALEAQGWTALL